ncbi:hypothetical protein BDW71DRAFT_126332 [Aspergillus fruticulosus]
MIRDPQDFICQCHEDQRSQYEHQTLDCAGSNSRDPRIPTCLVTIFLCSVVLTGGNPNCTIVIELFALKRLTRSVTSTVLLAR